jgi:hypothetical protein
MSEPTDRVDRRERSSEDPWTVTLRVVHDLRRDGIAVDLAGDSLARATRHAAALLFALGVHAEAPDEGD